MMTLSRWKIIAVLASAIFGLLFTLPNLLPASTLAALPAWMPHQKLNLGLDLQGGSYLLLEVDTNALRAERLTNLAEEVGTQLRTANIAITDTPQAGVAGGTDIIVSTRADQHVEVNFAPQAQAADAAKAVDQSIEIIRRRI